MTEVHIDNTEFGALTCPKCGGNNLHQQAVHVWQRYTEDSETGTYTCADYRDSRVEEKASMKGNPSRRRDGLTIEFSCENCGGFNHPPEVNPGAVAPNFFLHILQHKGTTYVSWDTPSI